MEEKDEIEISLDTVFGVIRKNIVFIIAMVLIFSLGSFFITKYCITKTYTAKISLYVDTSNGNDDNYSGSAANDLNSYNYAQKLVATYIRMLNTKTFYSSLSEKVDSKYSAAELSSMITFSDDDTTEIFDAVVVSKNPTDAKEIADAIADIAPETISRLNVNAELKIVDYASVPSTPSSPSMSKNLMLGFAAGLVLSLLVAFIRHFLDKKIKYNEEMSEIYGFPIIGAIPHFKDSIETIAKFAE
jgi:capsular polysaccharide biosynthesis protein